MVSLTTKGLYAETKRSLSVGVATFGRYLGITHGLLSGAPKIYELAEKQGFAVDVLKIYFRDVKKKDTELKVLIKHISMEDF